MIKVARLVIGAAMNFLIWVMLLLNVFVLACIKKGKLWSGGKNGVYLLTTFNIVCDLAQLIVHALYIGPSILMGESLGVTVVAVLFLEFWILTSLIQVLLATNRLFVIRFPAWNLFSSKRKTYLCMVVTFFFSVAATLYHQLLTACCRTIPDYRWYGYSILQIDNLKNDSYYFGLSLDATVTVYSGISYIALMIHIKKIVGSTSTAFKREIRCFIQFFLIFVTYGVIWITFYLYPVVGFQTPEAYAVTPMLLVFNSGVNSIIFLSLNRDIIVAARKLVHKDNAIVAPINTF